MKLPDKMVVILIGLRMLRSGINRDFVYESIKAAFEYEGILDLLHLWNTEGDDMERERILVDIWDLINEIT